MLGVLARGSCGDRGLVASAFGTNSPFAAVQRFRLQLEERRTCWQDEREACSWSMLSEKDLRRPANRDSGG
jgi:hypothetical protein